MKLRLWPDTLFGRLVLILVIGMFGGQLLTSTIWFQVHDARTLEMPARLFASRLADAVRWLERSHDGRAGDEAQRAVLAALDDERFQLRAIAAPAPPRDLPLAQHAVSDLIATLVARRLHEPVEVRVLDAELHDGGGRRDGILSLFSSRMPYGVFHAQARLRDGTWIDVHATETQAGLQMEPRELVLDYLVRIYLVRFAAVLLIALLAVRFAVRPLKRLAGAARALGHNLHRPPLDVSGPAEVRLAAQSLNTMQQQLLDGIAERTRFLAAVSHDLRSPLTRLRLRTEMLPSAEWRERLRGDLDEMEAMVGATLDAVRGVEITEARHDIDVDSLLESLADDAREAGRDVTVEGRATAPLAGYPRNLKRCLQNLLDNALRHGSTVRIAVHDDGQTLRIAIRDDGPGIPAAELEKVFEPYYRASTNAAAHDSGAGLGLTIARSIAGAHGGTLALRNRAAGGVEAVLVMTR
ncbi:ATP-binding protein [Paraburkholderia acidisoli]|uniref:histidine kinase n=1 Tax=Paraburkholderia acidisoli TaxID=2571748 RepID=A0A7Z2GQW3_9BURK|nr:ATP-binding protein [Paraburkholderia acidisoli]QGZ66237.1 HAMP domain-containing protein [Paraburkholderia acidisoli]